MREPWPVILLTGALGSGKTTVLRHLVADARLKGMAVLINELGEIGLDHHLIERVDGDVVLMRSGCLCCSVRGDLPGTLRQLERRWLAGTLDELHGVAIETTGMADPGPILAILASNPLINAAFRLRRVVTTVDATFGLRQIGTLPELLRQLATADLILMTKIDLAGAPPPALLDRLAAINPLATIVPTRNGVIDASTFFGDGLSWPRRTVQICETPTGSDHGDIGALSFRRAAPVNWPAFQHQLADLVAAHAPRLLRLKAMLDVAGTDRPTILHGIHETFYPLEQLVRWPDDERCSQVVIIIEGFTKHANDVAGLISRDGEWRPV